MATGMTDAERKDFKLMKALADDTIIQPDRRSKDVIDFIKRVAQKLKFIQVDQRPYQTKALQNAVPSLEIGGRKRPDIGRGAKFDIKGQLY